MTAAHLLKKYEIEINQQDFNLIQPLISDDCQFWFTSGTYSGVDQVRKAFEKTWNLIKDETYWITDLQWIANSHEVAVCTYTFNWKGLIEGTMCAGQGRGTSCLRQVAGQWKIVHEHLSHFPKPGPN